MAMRTTTIFGSAVDLAAEAGFSVFPSYGINDGRCACGDLECEHPGKHPACAHGFKDASRDYGQLKTWLFQRQDRNVSIATEVSGLVVIDVDPRNGGDETWAAMVAELGEGIEDTVQVNTGGGGRHIYYEAPAGVRIKSGSNVLGPGVDLKAGGGAVVAPPSRHLLGPRYEWAEDHSIYDRKPADLPQALLDRILAAQSGTRESDGEDEGGGEPTTGFDLLRALGGVTEGGRNEAIFKAACAFRSANVPKKVAAQACLEAAAKCTPPFSKKEARAIVARVYKSYPPGREPRHDEPGHQRPIIVIEPGRLPWLVDAAEKILCENHEQWRLYERAGLPMQVTVIAERDRENQKTVRRPSGAVVMRQATAPMIEDTLTRAIDWRQIDEKVASPERLPPDNCPPKVAQVLLSRVPSLPSLVGVLKRQ